MKHMTNWLCAELPRRLAPPGFNADYLCAPLPHAPAPSAPPAPAPLTCSHLCRSYSRHLPQGSVGRLLIAAVLPRLARRRQQPVKPVGSLLQRPQEREAARPAARGAHVGAHMPPMFDRLQSSYADVRHEMNTMRDKYPKSRILFIAGDGLSLMRMNHLLASEPEEFLDQSPAVVPIQGAGLGSCPIDRRATCVFSLVTDCLLLVFGSLFQVNCMAFSTACTASGDFSGPSS